ncbi:hypothetical protein GGR55DRAFT_674466 [Xylaria sp. FL0064]|nr:hypothetical protein GGR55DRAFT_674466 [Xylaria sp. FL0064]
MPVTELAFIPSATPGTIPPAFLKASWEGIEAQKNWAAANASSALPSGPPAVRGAAIYQQREDKGIMLITAHWDSPAQHAECIASEENREAMRALASHSVASEIKFFHLDGVQLFGRETLDAGLLSMLRVCVGEGRREEIERVWNDSDDGVRKVLFRSSGFEHIGGWRIEKEQGKEDRDEFVVVGAWRDEDALSRFAEGKEWDQMWKGVVFEKSFTTYSRLA